MSANSQTRRSISPFASYPKDASQERRLFLKRSLIMLAFLTALSLMTFLALLAVSASSAQAAQPLDLTELKRQGLSEKNRDIIVTQALTRRGRPPLEIGFVMEIVGYGGNELAQAYLEMDSRTGNDKASPLPPESLKNLMTAKIPTSEIINLIASVENSQKADQTAALGAGAVTVVSGGVIETDLMDSERRPDYPVAPQSLQTEIPAEPATPEQYASLEPSAVSLSTPSTPSRPSASAPSAPSRPTPADLRHVPQTLYPGQKADPARPMPENPGPYWSRSPRGHDDRFMGVVDQAKADGHRYEVHTNARGGRLGQEVLSRASGRKVYRHYSMKPELALESPQTRSQRLPEEYLQDYADPSDAEADYYSEYELSQEDEYAAYRR
ncbi:MAG: hypothetical protein LBJ64_10820 [Deltaproteobacteria bacterium]|jgi:hypothetical protein|nr:hypothetical protein [Deltaproteobacteria bacterium]